MGSIKEIGYPKVLVVSHNVFSKTTNMGKTMAAFFQGWPIDNLAQLYLHSEIPNVDICNKYFRITDFDMIKSILYFKKPGTVLSNSDINLNKTTSRVDKGLESNMYQLARKRSPYMLLIRNLLWHTGIWKTKLLKQWICEFNPDVVFYAAGDCVFSMKIATWICKENNIPLVVYFGDDYYFIDIHKSSFINYINRKIYHKHFENMFSYLSSFVAASSRMQGKYSAEFKKPGYTIMNSTNVVDNINTPLNIKISYIGNLGLNRWKSLIEIGTQLKRVGQILDVYSEEKRQYIIMHLNPENGIYFHGAIASHEVEKVIQSSTIIIHVESMDEINIKKVKYSMSTKIAESLGSGVCLFAYGPSEVSSIEYLIENDCACIVTKREDLPIRLKEILNSKELRERYIKNALRQARKKHNFEINTRLINEILREACASSEEQKK